MLHLLTSNTESAVKQAHSQGFKIITGVHSWRFPMNALIAAALYSNDSDNLAIMHCPENMDM